jgi:hypothetical protein
LNIAMVRIPRIVAYGIAVIAVNESWCLSMLRPVGVENEEVVNAIVRVLQRGSSCPGLRRYQKWRPSTCLGCMEAKYLRFPFLSYGVF